MTRRASFRQNDLTRVFKALAKAGVRANIDLLPDRTIRITPLEGAGETTVQSDPYLRGIAHAKSLRRAAA